jgi:hypothetical protein
MDLSDLLEYLMDTFSNPQCDSWSYAMYNFRDSGVQMSVFRTDHLDHQYGLLIMGSQFIVEGWADLIDGEMWQCGSGEFVDGELNFRHWFKTVDENTEIPVIESGY